MKDLLVIGAGTAGLSAALYANLFGLDFVILEATQPGGIILQAKRVNNLLGFIGLSGEEIIARFMEHMEKEGVEVRYPEPVIDVELAGKTKIVRTQTDIYEAKTLIITTGTRFLGLSEYLGVEGEEQFVGKGVSYCPECDGPLYRGKTVMVVGSAFDALFMMRLAKQTYYLGPIPERERTQVNVEMLKTNGIEYLEGRLWKLEGDRHIEAVRLDGQVLPVDGLFVTLRKPVSTLFRKLGIALTDDEFIRVDRAMQTSVDGIFAAGDITGQPWQVAKSLGEGAIAAISAYKAVSGQTRGMIGGGM